MREEGAGREEEGEREEREKESADVGAEIGGHQCFSIKKDDFLKDRILSLECGLYPLLLDSFPTWTRDAGETGAVHLSLAVML